MEWRHPATKARAQYGRSSVCNGPHIHTHTTKCVPMKVPNFYFNEQTNKTKKTKRQTIKRKKACAPCENMCEAFMHGRLNGINVWMENGAYIINYNWMENNFHMLILCSCTVRVAHARHSVHVQCAPVRPIRKQQSALIKDIGFIGNRTAQKQNTLKFPGQTCLPIRNWALFLPLFHYILQLTD